MYEANLKECCEGFSENEY